MGWIAGLAIVLVTASGAGLSGRQLTTPNSTTPTPFRGWRSGNWESGAWRDAPEFVALFAPADARASAYRAYVAPVDLDDALRALASDRTLRVTPGALTPRILHPLDAFGQTGRYDRARLARLYGARRPRVARGSRAADGALEAWTLVSPYPDSSLRRLEPGTLALVLRRP